MEGGVDEKICPFCGKPNGCMARSAAPCWCNGVEIPAALLELVPSSVQGRACICLPCINAYRRDPEAFASQHCGTP